MANIKNNFRKWVENQFHNETTKYSKNSSGNYATFLNSFYDKYEYKIKGKDNLFDVSNKDDAMLVINYLKPITKKLSETILAYHSDFRVGRDLYIKFLIEYFKLDLNYYNDINKLSNILANKNNLQNTQNINNNKLGANKNIDVLEKQLIFYGAPGTGKSRELNKRAKVFGSNIERVTFHPSFTYGAFVGSFKPYSKDGKITYKYIAGVFIRLLVKALKNENENYLLIIEEINRANTAAVFGDMFQLLDRDKNGESEYEISISDELKEHLDEESVNNLKNNKLYLPKNFYIWATMNNADQGVMPLDTAFKRRWDFEYMPLDLTKEDEEQLQGLKLEWNKLRKNINKKLLSLGINEDKMLGFYFLNCKALENEDNYLKALQNKVLMYLYEDVLRHCRAKVFGEKTFAQIEDIRNIFLNQQEQNQDENM